MTGFFPRFCFKLFFQHILMNLLYYFILFVQIETFILFPNLFLWLIVGPFPSSTLSFRVVRDDMIRGKINNYLVDSFCFRSSWAISCIRVSIPCILSSISMFCFFCVFNSRVTVLNSSDSIVNVSTLLIINLLR